MVCACPGRGHEDIGDGEAGLPGRRAMPSKKRKWNGICGEAGCCLEALHAGQCEFTPMEQHDYEVEAIIDQRGTKYLVKWKNW